MSGIWKWIKNKLVGSIKEAALKEIEKMDRYEVELADLIKKYANPDKTAKVLVDWIQNKLRELVEKVM